MNLLLASSSTYRRALLERLNLVFTQVSPDIDETAMANESAHDLVVRLSRQKAEALASQYLNTLIIASDQVAELDGLILGKPGTEQRAIEQLSQCSGRQVRFHTGLCLLNTRTGHQQVESVEFSVWFRSLTRSQIEGYVRKELPLDCAGSFKCEGLGIALFERMEGQDPNSLIGLPLIRLVSMLGNEGVDVLT